MVCNMPFQNYMQAEQDWATLAHAIAKCRDLGLVVWLYDEQGYPGGLQATLVLDENPDFEATELASDAVRAEPYVIRKSYEFTHANNNYHASRRYANLIDDQAMNCFVEKTHDAYWDRLQPLFGSTIEAMFTDEPSLLAVSLGQIPEEARKRRGYRQTRPVGAFLAGCSLVQRFARQCRSILAKTSCSKGSACSSALRMKIVGCGDSSGG